MSTSLQHFSCYLALSQIAPRHKTRAAAQRAAVLEVCEIPSNLYLDVLYGSRKNMSAVTRELLKMSNSRNFATLLTKCCHKDLDFECEHTQQARVANRRARGGKLLGVALVVRRVPRQKSQTRYWVLIRQNITGHLREKNQRLLLLPP